MMLHSCPETFHDHLPDSACRVSPKPCGPAFKTSHSLAPADLSSVVCKCGCVLSKLDRWSSQTSLSVLPLNSYSCCRTCSWPSDVYCMISVRSCRVCQIEESFSRFFLCRNLQRRDPSLCSPRRVAPSTAHSSRLQRPWAGNSNRVTPRSQHCTWHMTGSHIH